MSSQPMTIPTSSSEVVDTVGQMTRSSDRIYLELPIVITGTNPTGMKFAEATQTLVISRRGAKILSHQKLAPRQLLAIRCIKTGMDAGARVVGLITGDEDGCHYAIAFIHQEVNFWGVDFPLLDGSESAAARVFLECTSCGAQQVAHLDVFELEVLLANECLTRPCQKCNKPSLWTRAAASEELFPAIREAADHRHTRQERKSPRIKLKVDACVRNPKGGNEVVTTENVSRGGFRFLARNEYPLGATIEAALPYSAGSANIFTPAKIIHRQEGFAPGVSAYGVAYLPSSLAPSLTGLRLTQAK